MCKFIIINQAEFSAERKTVSIVPKLSTDFATHANLNGDQYLNGAHL